MNDDKMYKGYKIINTSPSNSYDVFKIYLNDEFKRTVYSISDAYSYINNLTDSLPQKVCSCGSRHTSFPDHHLDWCDTNKPYEAKNSNNIKNFHNHRASTIVEFYRGFVIHKTQNLTDSNEVYYKGVSDDYRIVASTVSGDIKPIKDYIDRYLKEVEFEDFIDSKDRVVL